MISNPPRAVDVTREEKDGREREIEKEKTKITIGREHGKLL